MEQKQITLVVNGQKHELQVKSHRTLLEILREELHLTGAKKGCGEGACGACTVIINGEIVNSCLVLGSDAHGKEIITIEGLGKPEALHPLQLAFVEEGAVQCGFCTPGMILAAKVLLDRQPDPQLPEIREALSGNLCRCTGYIKIIRAVQRAGKYSKGENFPDGTVNL